MVLDTRINTYTTNNQQRPSVTALTDGGFVVTWESDGQDGSTTGIYGQRYDDSGNPLGAEFRADSYHYAVINISPSPSVTALTDGGFVVTWQSLQSGGIGIYGHRYDASGNPQGAEFHVNSHNASSDFGSSVAALTNGGFVVTWNYDEDIYGQRHDASGNKQGEEFRVNSDIYGIEFHDTSSVTALTDGGFVVTWTTSYGAHESTRMKVNGQRYDANGNIQGEVFCVCTPDALAGGSSVIALTDGSFVVTWDANYASLYGYEEDWVVHGQRYNASGYAQGAEFLVNSGTTNALHSSGTPLTDGGFVLTWMAYSLHDGSDESIRGQRYDASGNKQGAEFHISSYTSNIVGNPSVTTLTDGGFVVTWHSNNVEDNLHYDVYGKRFDANGNEVEWVGTYNPEPEEIETTPDNLIVAALNLSARAYSDTHLKDQKDEVNVATKNWSPLREEDLVLNKEGDKFEVVNGNLLRYEYENTSATVGLTMLDGKRTLGIGFEGTNTTLTYNSASDIYQDFVNIQKYYDSLSDFTQAVFNYAMESDNSIEQILVTGHSLGGAAAQNFMYDYGHINSKFVGVTFGSPGTNVFQTLPEERFVNIRHTGDVVALGGELRGYKVSGSVVNAIVDDPVIETDSLYEHTLFLPSDSEVSYRETVEFITSQLDAKTLFRDTDIVSGTNEDDNLDSSAGFKGEILLGGRGVDTMTGGLDSQIFMGGFGNDIIDGGSGIDNAIYNSPRANYALSLNESLFFADQRIVTDKRLAPGSDGTDTLENIERLIFTDSGLAFDLDGSGGNAGKVAKLIGAVFGAESVSKADYVAIGLYYLDTGTSYEDLAAGAILIAGAKSPEQIVTLLWTNIFDSPPTADEAQPYIDMLNSGTSVGKLGVSAAEYSLNQTNINLVGLVENGIVFDPLHYQPIG